MPTITFNTIDDLIAYVNNNIKENHMELITGPIHNNVENGIIDYVKQATLNYFKADVVSTGGDVVLDANITVLFSVPPTSLTWGDNFGNEWYILNMTSEDIPLAGSLVYYNMTSTPLSIIPKNSIVHVGKAKNDLWVLLSGDGSGGGGSTQKQPKTYKVGVTSGAPVAGVGTWTNPEFANSYVVLILGRSITFDLEDIGEGAPWVDKTLSSDTLSVQNYAFQDGDIITAILITP